MSMQYLHKIRAVFLVILLASTAVKADDNVLDDIKSVYIYNFLSFIEWPGSSAPVEGQYLLCANAEKAFIDRLSQVVKNEKVNGLPIKVVSLSDAVSADACQLLYLQEGIKQDSRLLSELKTKGVLLVGESSSFVSSDIGMIGFETRGRKVRVAVNLTNLQEAGFKVSSKLLRVVRIER